MLKNFVVLVIAGLICSPAYASAVTCVDRVMHSSANKEIIKFYNSDRCLAALDEIQTRDGKFCHSYFDVGVASIMRVDGQTLVSFDSLYSCHLNLTSMETAPYYFYCSAGRMLSTSKSPMKSDVWFYPSKYDRRNTPEALQSSCERGLAQAQRYNGYFCYYANEYNVKPSIRHVKKGVIHSFDPNKSPGECDSMNLYDIVNYGKFCDGRNLYSKSGKQIGRFKDSYECGQAARKVD